MRFPFLGAPNKIEKSPLLCVFLYYLNIHASGKSSICAEPTFCMCKFAFYPQFAPSRTNEKIDSEGGVISFGSCIMGAIGYECMRRCLMCLSCLRWRAALKWSRLDKHYHSPPLSWSRSQKPKIGVWEIYRRRRRIIAGGKKFSWCFIRKADKILAFVEKCSVKFVLPRKCKSFISSWSIFFSEIFKLRAGRFLFT